jgi:hypothetical protein
MADLEKRIADLEKQVGELQAANSKCDEIIAKNDELIAANAELQKQNGVLTAKFDEACKEIASALESMKAPVKSSLTLNKKEVEKPLLKGDSTTVKYSANGKETKGKFKLKMYQLIHEGVTYTEPELLANAKVMKELVEGTYKNGFSPFVEEVFE